MAKERKISPEVQKLFDDLGRSILSLVSSFDITPRQYFLRLFPSDQWGEVILNELIEQNIIDPDTLKWDLTTAAKQDLARLLMYLRQGHVFTNKKISVPDLVIIAKRAFDIDISDSTLRNCKGKSKILDDLNI